MGASFLALAISGIYAFFKGYASVNVFIHVIFGWIFLIGVMFHFVNNIKPLKRYSSKINVWVLPSLLLMLVIGTLTSFQPIQEANAWYKSYKTTLPREEQDEFTLYQFGDEDKTNLEIEIMAGHHFWFPQVAIWMEDSLGNYLETVMVTYSTAKGVFYGDRTKDNFKELDKSDDVSSEKAIIRVDALPYWSHKRNVKDKHGYYAPSEEFPLPDAISGATPQGNFKLKASTDTLLAFNVLLEVNVAFDDNEYYSEFDFADDSLYHSGAGLLGQPSLIYQAQVRRGDNKKYYLMDLKGKGHHSGQTGLLYKNLSSITTAMDILERVIVRVE